MSQLSPDGMYYWDGTRWLSTVSPDGRYRWNGTAWVPTAWASYVQPEATVRQPTSWTRPLQYAVAGWYGISALLTLSAPFWMRDMMSQMVRASIQRSQEQNPNARPLPPGFYDTMTSMMNGVLWVAAVIGLAIAILVIVGALQRWTWMYYAVLVLLGLGVLSGPANLVNLATGSYSSAYGYSPPSWLFVLGALSWIPSTALFVFMLVGLIKYGPWGMRKVPAGPPAA